MIRGKSVEPADDVTPYEQRLSQDRRWALSEASQFFLGKGGVQEALERIGTRLNELSIPYAVAGGMALFQHGYRRFTEDIDILVTRESLKRIQENLEGLGYIRPFNLKDTERGVRIEFLITGDYRGALCTLMRMSRRIFTVGDGGRRLTEVK